MSTIGWFRPTIGTTPLPNRSMNSQSLKLRACFVEYPLASKIIVRNLSYTTSESFLKEEFSNFGQIAEVKLVKDQRSNKSKGYAFVQYTNQDDAMSALEAMDEKYVDGRVVFVELAKPIDKRTAYPKTSGPPQESSYSGQKQAED
ncbi:putative RNA recognition motif domain, nucleotide-binding alpha-beta plait domain superfamily [Helianthus annuus]|uniref:Putative RNA-binding (RRM/RBD/RNP motifs) family protein n=1 Tax=Helianthus annuus TaxID=4232 RepID=A0A251SGH3_HELAN|nr:organelle RRM domain-containing protein 6, chloroplastic [Helianthus annuus]KAF5768804.1 putative RNA recognition motif domain, nucleotide-binding alpha-beta plait domain superfamily [Helianthus annuus]KAJ0468316.1 putative RNA recognition motif domain, nucleotide-binding alpha-beta plait domain superfamily [Helianthus annuus]